MNILEYQAKAILAEFGVPVPKGVAVFSAEEAVAAAKELGKSILVTFGGQTDDECLGTLSVKTGFVRH